MPNLKIAFVTGGGGFLGMALCKALLKQGVIVHSYSRKLYPELEKLGIITHQGDIADLPTLLNAIPENVDCIFHTCSLTDMWGKYEKFYSTNVIGTQNVLQGCKLKKIKYCIYTSSPSVIFNGKSIKGASEKELPYPQTFLAYYPQTKAMAERMVLRANCNDPNGETFLTLALRPHLIWGPGDNSIRPRLIQMANNNQLKIIGDGKNIVDVTYIDNAVHAHILAAKTLMNESELYNQGPCSGQAYFIADEKPVELWKFIPELLGPTFADKFEKIQKIPTKIAYAIAYLLEQYHTKRGMMDTWPKLTRFACLNMAQDHYFSHLKAKVDIGYEPCVDKNTGLQNLFR